jgi:hypothetical protein
MSVTMQPNPTILVNTLMMEGTCQPGMCHLTLTSFSWATDFVEFVHD